MNFQSKYPYPDFPADLLTFRAMDTTNFFPHSHWHEDLELILVEEAGLQIQIEDHFLKLHAGQGIFINQNVLHTISHEAGEPCDISALRFLPGILFDSTGGMLTGKYRDLVLTSPRLRYLLLDKDSRDTGDLLQLVRQLIFTMRARTEGYELDIKALLYAFWKHLVQLSGQTKLPAMGRQSQLDNLRIKTAIQFIEHHFAEPLTLEDIAASIHTSSSECCRCFRRALDTTPFEYLLKYRIYEAAARLAQRETAAETISQLAASVGFNSPSYFNKKFREYLHCTPKEYRYKAHS